MRYRPEIDGLRALAVVPVILFHAGFSAFAGGFVGVDVFFVISGYLITSIIMTGKQRGTFSLADFYERRARRILPALFLVLFACLPFAWIWLFPSHLKSFSQSLIAVAMFVSNILFWRTSGYFDISADLKPLLHTWSLAVEEQYYLVFPILFSLAWGFRKRWIFICLVLAASISLGAAQWGAINKPTAAFYLLPTRGWEILIGALASFYSSRSIEAFYGWAIREIAGISGLILVVYAVFSFNSNVPYPSLYTLVPTIGAALIILFGNSETLVGKLLSLRLPMFIGQISYSAYLWHQPIFAFARHRSLGEPSQLLRGELVMAVPVLAYFSWKYVEAPFRSTRLMPRRQLAVWIVLCSCSFITLGLVGFLNDGFPDRFDGKLADLLNPESTLTSTGIKCLSQGAAYITPENSCILGSHSTVIGALVGDSHAFALAYELGNSLSKKRIGLAEMIFTGCPPIGSVYRVDMDAEDKCAEFNETTATYLKQKEQFRIILVVSRWTRYLNSSGFDNLEGGIEHTNDLVDTIEGGIRQRHTEKVRIEILKKKIISSIKDLLIAGKTVVLVYPIPEVGWDAPIFLTKEMAFVEKSKIITSTSYDAFKERNRSAIETLDSIGEHKNLIRIYPDKLLCNTYIKERCVISLNGQSLYVDTNHLSNAGAQLIASDIVEQIAKQR